MATESLSAGSSAYIITGAAGALAGPVYGPAALMIFGAVIGALLALQGTKTDSNWEAVRFCLIAIGISLALTGAGVWAIEKFTPLPGNIALMPVALFFAAARNMIIGAIQKILDRLVTLTPGKGDAP